MGAVIGTGALGASGGGAVRTCGRVQGLVAETFDLVRVSIVSDEGGDFSLLIPTREMGTLHLGDQVEISLVVLEAGRGRLGGVGAVR